MTRSLKKSTKQNNPPTFRESQSDFVWHFVAVALGNACSQPHRKRDLTWSPEAELEVPDSGNWWEADELLVTF